MTILTYDPPDVNTQIQAGQLHTGSAWDGWALEDIYQHFISRGENVNTAAALVDSILTNRLAAYAELAAGNVPANVDPLVIVAVNGGQRQESPLLWKDSDFEKTRRLTNVAAG